MTMIDPVINWDIFLKDVNNGMSAYNLQDKHKLTPRQYRHIMRNVKRKDGFSRKRSRVIPFNLRSKFQEPYVSLKKDGHYIIRKNSIYYGQYDNLETARLVKKELIKCRWDKTQLNKIRKGLGLKPMRSYQYE